MIVNAQVTPFRRVVHRSRVVALAARALAAGGIRQSLTLVEWNCAGHGYLACTSPVSMEIEGRLDAVEKRSNWIHTEHDAILRDPRNPHGLRDITKWKASFEAEWPLTVLMHMPCRHCQNCLRRRARHWRERAMQETAAATRTWFGTLTLSAEAHSHVTMICHANARLGGNVFESLSSSEQFLERHKVISGELTRWLKRVRKESQATLRYILVAEAHKSGLPHYHCLVHEKYTVPVGERTLRRQWTLGFSKWNLVKGEDQREAAYVTKYLSKAALARVRASVRYGTTS